MGTCTRLCMGWVGLDGTKHTCSKVLGTIPWDGPDDTTHGVCLDCYGMNLVATGMSGDELTALLEQAEEF